LSQQETHTRIYKDDLTALRAIQPLGQTIAQTIHSILTDNQPASRGLTLVKLQIEDFKRLQNIMRECGFKDVGCVIHQILQSQATTDIVSVEKVMKERVRSCFQENHCQVSLFLSRQSYFQL
jgi:hypothetical protein